MSTIRACGVFILLPLALLAAGNAGGTSAPPPTFTEGRLVTEPGVEIYWSTAGEGPTVIVPGGFLFGNDLDALARSHRLVLYDMRNRGRSAAVSDPALLTLDGDVRDLEALRRHLQIDSFAAVGYSYLGKMVVLYALAHPQRIERLVQIGPVPMRFGAAMPSLWDNSHQLVTDHEAIARLRRLRAEGLHERQPAAYCEEEWRVQRVRLVGDPRLAAGLAWRCDLPNEWPVRLAEHLRWAFPSAQRADVDGLGLARLAVPVLTIHGTRDRNAPYGGGREWAATLPEGRLRTVEGAAHQAWVDDPTVLDDLATFLAGRWPAAAVDLELALETPLSQLRGLELLRRVLAAAQPTRAAGGEVPSALALRYRGALFRRGQSYSATPPYDRQPLTAEVLLAARGAQVVVDEELEGPDDRGSRAGYRTVSRPGGGFALDLAAGRAVPPQEEPREIWRQQLVRVPPYLVEQLLATPQAVRLLGVDRAAGEPQLRVEGQLGAERLSLWIDGASRVRRVARLVADPLTGDGLEVTELVGEREVEGLVVPRRVRRTLDGVSVAELEVAAGANADLARFTPPPGVAPAAPGAGRMVERPAPTLAPLAPDVWLLRDVGGAGYHVLVVGQDDGLVVIEAPVSEAAMREALALLAQLLPGRPLVAAALTHHHFDHIGGVRAVMAAGARLYVPRGSEELFLRIAAAPRSGVPGAAALDPWSLQVEGVAEATIAPQRRGPRIELLALADGGHAAGMLLAWLPERGVLFQADLFAWRRGEPAAAPRPAAALLAEIERRRLPVEQLVGGHGEVATLADLRRAAGRRGAGD